MRYFVQLRVNGQDWATRTPQGLSLRQAKRWITDLEVSRNEYRRTQGAQKLDNISAQIVDSRGRTVVKPRKLK